MKIRRFKQCPLSNSNIFYKNFMKLGRIIKYHDVFKFQIGQYRIMPSGVIALC